METLHLAPADWIIVSLYFVLCQLMSAAFRFRSTTRNSKNSDDHLAHPSMTWVVVGSSIVATNIGSHTIIGMAGSAADKGIASVAYEWEGVLGLLLLGYLFSPLYKSSGVRTVPEYMYKRFRSKPLRVYFAIISILGSLTTKMAVDMYATGLFLKHLFDEQCDVYLSSFLLLSFTAIYTLLGGLTSVMYVGALQCLLLLNGSLAVSVLGVQKVGGLGRLWDEFPRVVGNVVNVTQAPYTTTVYPNTTFRPFTAMNITTTAVTSTVSALFNVVSSHTAYVNTTNTSTIMLWNTTTTTSVPNTTTTPFINSTHCYRVDEHWNYMFRPLTDTQLPWLGMVTSIQINVLWYWCTNQVFVQQTLTSNNSRNTCRATLLAGILNLLPFILIVIPGMCARVLQPDTIACTDATSCTAACGNPHGCTHLAYVKLISGLELPQGVVGLVFVMILSAMMSSLSSTLVSVSTVFTNDIWKTVRHKASEREVVHVGRIVVVLAVGFAMVSLPLIKAIDPNVSYRGLQMVQSYIAPSICAAVVIAMCSVRVTESATLIGLILGVVIAIIRCCLDVKYPSPSCGEDDERPPLVRLHFLYSSALAFIASLVSICVLSVCTQPQPLELLGKLTWFTMDKEIYCEDGSTGTQVVEMGMDNKTFTDSTVVDQGGCERNHAVVEGEVKLSRSELFEKWIGGGFLVTILIALFAVFA